MKKRKMRRKKGGGNASTNSGENDEECGEKARGLLHKSTKPTAWRGGALILKNRSRCKVANEELKKSEETLPKLKECDLEKASRLY